MLALVCVHKNLVLPSLKVEALKEERERERGREGEGYVHECLFVFISE